MLGAIAVIRVSSAFLSTCSSSTRSLGWYEPTSVAVLVVFFPPKLRHDSTFSLISRALYNTRPSHYAVMALSSAATLYSQQVNRQVVLPSLRRARARSSRCRERKKNDVYDAGKCSAANEGLPFSEREKFQTHCLYPACGEIAEHDLTSHFPVALFERAFILRRYRATRK